MKDNNYILIVEDSPTQARQLESSLRQLGYNISTASTGKEALAILKRQKPIIIISDILMPEMDGYQLCKQIKSDSSLKDIPVVLLTQLSDPVEVINGLVCGADDFIVKPYSEKLLLTRIQSIIALKLKHGEAGKQIKILVVEDSPTQAESLKYMLEEHGYAAVTARNGKQALEMAKKIIPSIIISDIVMPGMDGYELTQELKRDKELKDIPIILVTAFTDSKKSVSQAVVVAADGYFTKPYDDSYLLSKIESLISNRHGKTGDTEALDVDFAGRHYVISADSRRILTFLISTYENSVRQNRELLLMQHNLQVLNEQLEEKVMERTKQLLESEESFRKLAEDAKDAIVIIGAEGKYLYANRQTAETTGYGVHELLDMGIKDMFPPDDLPTVMERFTKRIAEMPLSNHYEPLLVAKDGRKIPIEATSSNTVWHGQPALLVIFRDVTDRKKREEDRIMASKLESIGVFAGGIAHDFNNLLTGILGNASLAKTLCNPEDKIYKRLAELENAALRGGDLTRQLLTFAKGGASVKKTVSINKLVKESACFSLRGTNIKCDCPLPDDMWPVEADTGQISQVIHNLVINARQAMPEGGGVVISGENIMIGNEGSLPLRSGRYVKITVKDKGVGIPEKYLSKIFDPYFTTKEKGSGLGLATVYSIIKNHGGHITVESEIGKGTAFYIYLPASEKEIIPVKADEERPVSGKGKILVMDDEDIIRDVAGEILTELGYEVESAKNGAEAIKLYKNAKSSGRAFSAVILDLTVPGGMGGKEAVKKLLDIDPDVRAIVSSGYSDDPIMADFKQYGFRAVVTKPYNIVDISKAVYEVCKLPD